MSTIGNISRKINHVFHYELGQIFMLHRVVPERSREADLRMLEVTPLFLEQVIIQFREKGYRFVSMDEAVLIASGQSKKTKHQKFVSFTLDDGYFDTYEFAYPVFQKYNVPFLVYATPGFYDHKYEINWYEGVQPLTWEQLLELSKDPLCSIGAHTVSHRNLLDLSTEEALSEVYDSKNMLEERLGINIRHFSYPFGSFDIGIKKIVHDMGFDSAVNTWGGKIRKGDNDLFELNRIELRQE